MSEIKVPPRFEPGSEAAVESSEKCTIRVKGWVSGVCPGQLYHVIRGAVSSGHVPGAITLS